MVNRLFQSFFLFLLIASAGGWYYYTTTYPCAAPLQYRIGRFDTSFGISETDFLKTLEQASTLWSEPFGRPFFEYNPQGDLVINLIYDDRQKTTEQNKILQSDVNKLKQSADSTKAAYTALQNDYEASKQAYIAERARYEARIETYGAQVAYWNKQGGAPEKEYAQMEEEYAELNQQRTVLENKRLAMNALADQINAFIEKYNLIVSNANTTIDTLNQSAGKEFEEGEYDASTNEINIYEFSTDAKLVRVLAHELGHARGLDHNENVTSIMYPINKATTLSLSKEDIATLTARCNL